jgi:hypothetical protein
MSSLKKELLLPPDAAARPLRDAALRLAAGLLMVASASLARIAAALEPRAEVVPEMSREPRFEFHAEAGAPEGALYVDGELVGRLPGVRRL